jgi:hypothetical protein
MRSGLKSAAVSRGGRVIAARKAAPSGPSPFQSIRSAGGKGTMSSSLGQNVCNRSRSTLTEPRSTVDSRVNGVCCASG